MIDIKTLRLGSHVLANGVRAQVMRIDAPTEREIPKAVILRFKATVDGEVRYAGCLDGKGVEPIPITENELRRCGFVGDGPDVFIDHKSACIMREDSSRMPDVRICKCQDGYWGVAMECSSFHCRYLHELESLYYHVFKKELIEE